MPKSLGEIRKEILEIEARMAESSFWDDKEKAQTILATYQSLKQTEADLLKYDAAGASLTIYAGAGGDDAEDFSRMLLEMYRKYALRKGYSINLLYENKTNSGGYRTVTVEINGHKKGAYGLLKNESGVHRLVRLSPFNAKNSRETSFAMVEVVPVLEKVGNFSIPPQEIEFDFSKSGGPGGQNVNKRETAVRAVHIPTGISVHVSTERSQEDNRRKAVILLTGKIFKEMQTYRTETLAELSVSRHTENEWGSQIRSYILHPYKLVKDHRTEIESHNPEKVLEEGEIDQFIEAEAAL